MARLAGDEFVLILRFVRDMPELRAALHRTQESAEEIHKMITSLQVGPRTGEAEGIIPSPAGLKPCELLIPAA